jgi:hypothetical protein
MIPEEPNVIELAVSVPVPAPVNDIVPLIVAELAFVAKLLSDTKLVTPDGMLSVVKKVPGSFAVAVVNVPPVALMPPPTVPSVNACEPVVVNWTAATHSAGVTEAFLTMGSAVKLPAADIVARNPFSVIKALAAFWSDAAGEEPPVIVIFPAVALGINGLGNANVVVSVA